MIVVMIGRTYYNEFDPVAAHVLRELIKRGVIADGDVDERSITDVHPDDVKGYTQCHWFAGGGLWSVACRLGGWSDERSIWTASLPCQPFSPAGKRLGEDDPRHLWPHFHRIVRARRPAVIVGEQVAEKAGYRWFDGVRASLAGENYACRSIDFPSCAVNAPHKRNRQYWAAVNMADRDGARWDAAAQTGIYRQAQSKWSRDGEFERSYCFDGSTMADPEGNGREQRRSERETRADHDLFGPLDHAISTGLQGLGGHGDTSGRTIEDRSITTSDESNYWHDAEWIICHDGKARRTEPGIRFLVNGLPGRVDLWRIGGNAINPQAAAVVIEALRETLDNDDA